MKRFGLVWLTRALAPVVVLVLIMSACRVDVELGDQNAAPGRAESAELLPVLGPAVNVSHWHAAYVVRICDEVLEPFDSDAPNDGIHSHGDGLIHIHPFAESAAYENARLGVFADAMGFSLSTGELALPGGGTWRDGDTCPNGVEGRVYVDRWDSRDEAGAERFFDNPQDLRFEADGAMYQIAFAPIDSPPVIPPSGDRLSDVMPFPSDPVQPWVDIDPNATVDTFKMWVVAGSGVVPCAENMVVERTRYGTPACYEPGEPSFGPEVVTSARAVSFNGKPAVELGVSDSFSKFRDGLAPDSGDGVVVALELDGQVIVVAQLSPFTSRDRLVISGGFDEGSARALAEILNG